MTEFRAVAFRRYRGISRAGYLFLACWFCTGLHQAKADTEPPLLTAFTITPGSVDVTTGAQSVTIALTVTDDDTGVNQIQVSFYDPNSNYVSGLDYYATFPFGITLVSGHQNNGTYQGTFAVPQYSVPGIWSTIVSAWDTAGNVATYGASFTGFPAGADGQFTVLNTGPVDSAAPVLTAYTITPNPVDVTSGQQAVTVELSVTDDAAGLSGIYMDFYDATGDLVTGLSYDSQSSFNSLERISGNNNTGTYRGTITVPQFSIPGTWTSSVGLYDAAGRYRDYNPAFGNPFPTGITGELVVQNTGPVDSAAPVLTAYTITPNPVDVTSGQQAVTVELSVTDDAAGLSGIYMDFYDATGDLVLSGLSYDSQSPFNSLERVSGNGNTGTYRGTITVPQFSIPGTWTSSVGLYDAAGHYRDYNPAFGNPFPTGITGELVVQNTGPVDSAAPVLTAYTITPNPVDVTSGQQAVTVELSVTDDAAGLSGIYMDFYDATGDLVLSGLSYDSQSPFNSLERVSGNGNTGTYRGTITVPQFSIPGTWTSSVGLYDAAGRYRDYNPAFGNPFPTGITGELVVQNTGPVDSAAPVLTAYTITPNPVDVTSGQQAVTVELSVTDDAAGLSGIYMDFYDATGDLVLSGLSYDSQSPFNSLERVSGNGNAGTYRGTITVPQFSIPGTWTSSVSLYDAAGHYRDYNPAFGNPFPTGITGELVVQNTGPVDSAAPVLTAYTITPNPVDVTSGQQAVTVELSVTDDAAGLSGIYMDFYDATGDWVLSGLSYDSQSPFNSLERISGNGNAGTYRGTITVPQFSIPGTWTSSVSLYDAAGRYRDYNPAFGNPFPTGITGELVVQNTGPVDSVAPVLTAYTITPNPVDVTSGQQAVTVELSVTDDAAGLSGIYMDFYDATGDWVLSGLSYDSQSPFNSLERISGNGNAGTYRGTITVPQFSIPGTWTSSVSLYDAAGRYRDYNPAFGNPFPTGITGELVVQNTGPVDSAAPVLTAYTITPNPVDVTSGQQAVTVELSVTDDAAGLSGIYMDFYDATGDWVVSGLSYDSQSPFNSLERVSGNGNTGTYRGTITVPQFSIPGTWTSSVDLYDAVGRSRSYGGTFGDPFPSGITGQFTVHNSGVIDSEAPVITAYSTTPGVIDVSSGAQTVMVEMTVTDDAAGVSSIQVDLHHTDDNSVSWGFGFSLGFFEGSQTSTLQRVSGDDRNGVYRGTVTIPQFAEPGTWEAAVFLEDRFGRSRDYWEPWSPYPPGISTEFIVQNSGASDTQPPVLTSYTITPGTVDVTASSQQVVIEAVITDDVSGVDMVTVTLFGTDPYGSFSQSIPLSRVAGNATSGTYEGTFTVPLHTAPGIWSSSLSVTDNYSQVRSYGNYSPSGEPFPGAATGDITVLNSGQVGETLVSWGESLGLSGYALLPEADDEADGISFLQEYSFNLDPRLADLHTLESYPEMSTYSGLPRISVIYGTSGPVLNVSYLKRRNAIDLSYSVEVSSDVSGSPLAEWTETADSWWSYPIDVTWEYVTVQVQMPPDARAFFGRVRVSYTPSP